MGLFDKKYCDVCGAKIGFLGNRKLEDGNLCKDCAGKLSPFFSDRRNSTVAEMKRNSSPTAKRTGSSSMISCRLSPLTEARRFILTR